MKNVVRHGRTIAGKSILDSRTESRSQISEVKSTESCRADNFSASSAIQIILLKESRDLPWYGRAASSSAIPRRRKTQQMLPMAPADRPKEVLRGRETDP